MNGGGKGEEVLQDTSCAICKYSGLKFVDFGEGPEFTVYPDWESFQKKRGGNILISSIFLMDLMVWLMMVIR